MTPPQQRDERLWAEHLRVADDLWFISHNDRTGRPRVSAVALDHGLAAALLGELVLSRNIQIRDGRPQVLTRKLPNDPATLEILENILAEPQHDLRTWLSYLSQSAADTVAGRLVRAGMLRTTETRRFFKTTAVHQPIDPEGAFWRSSRLEDALLGNRGQVTWAEIFIGALMDIIGLLQIDIWDDPAAAGAVVRRYLAKGDPALRELTSTTHSLIGEAVLRLGR